MYDSLATDTFLSALTPFGCFLFVQENWESRISRYMQMYRENKTGVSGWILLSQNARGLPRCMRNRENQNDVARTKRLTLGGS